MKQTVSIKETRDNLAEIVNRVAYGGEEIIVTKNGTPKVKIVPVDDQKRNTRSDKKKKAQKFINKTFGIWKDREDMKDPEEWVRKIRSPRYTL